MSLPRTDPAGRRRPSGWWVAAVVAALLSLGLPWSTTDGYLIPGWFVPGTLVPNYDGTMDYLPGSFGLPIVIGGSTGSGYETTIRVFVAAVVVLLVLALRRRSTRLATVAVAVAVAGMLVTGLPNRAGGIAYVVALGCLVLALRRDGLLPDRRIDRAAARVLRRPA